MLEMLQSSVDCVGYSSQSSGLGLAGKAMRATKGHFWNNMERVEWTDSSKGEKASLCLSFCRLAGPPFHLQDWTLPTDSTWTWCRLAGSDADISIYRVVSKNPIMAVYQMDIGISIFRCGLQQFVGFYQEGQNSFAKNLQRPGIEPGTHNSILGLPAAYALTASTTSAVRL